MNIPFSFLNASKVEKKMLAMLYVSSNSTSTSNQAHTLLYTTDGVNWATKSSTTMPSATMYNSSNIYFSYYIGTWAHVMNNKVYIRGTDNVYMSTNGETFSPIAKMEANTANGGITQTMLSMGGAVGMAGAGIGAMYFNNGTGIFRRGSGEVVRSTNTTGSYTTLLAGVTDISAVVGRTSDGRGVIIRSGSSAQAKMYLVSDTGVMTTKTTAMPSNMHSPATSFSYLIIAGPNNKIAYLGGTTRTFYEFDVGAGASTTFTTDRAVAFNGSFIPTDGVYNPVDDCYYAVGQYGTDSLYLLKIQRSNGALSFTRYLQSAQYNTTLFPMVCLNPFSPTGVVVTGARTYNGGSTNLQWYMYNSPNGTTFDLLRSGAQQISFRGVYGLTGL